MSLRISSPGPRDRCPVAALAQGPTHRQPVDVRHLHVQQVQVGWTLGGELGIGHDPRDQSEPEGLLGEDGVFRFPEPATEGDGDE